jgi:hypothetical protein
MKEIKKEKPQLITHALYGRVRLEKYKERGLVVSIRGNKETFWMDWKRFDKIYNKFVEIVKYKNNNDKKNGK